MAKKTGRHTATIYLFPGPKRLVSQNLTDTQLSNSTFPPASGNPFAGNAHFGSAKQCDDCGLAGAYVRCPKCQASLA